MSESVGQSWDWNKPGTVPSMIRGHGEPFGVVAPIGTFYINLDSYLEGNTESCFFVKTWDDNGSRGWAAYSEYSFAWGQIFITDVSPNTGARGTAVDITISGGYFPAASEGGGVQLSVSGTGITLSNVTRVDRYSITATFTIAANAPLTARDITASGVNVGTATKVAAFTITA